MPGVLTLARLRRAAGNSVEAMNALDEGMVIALDRNLDRFRLGLINERIKYLVQDGDISAAIKYAKNTQIIDISAEPLPQTGMTTRDELVASSWVRIALGKKNLGPALHVAKHWRSFCAKRGAIRSLVRWNLLYAQLYFLDGQESEAQRPLREALTLASASSLRRSFIDEGALIKTLLTNAYDIRPVTSEPAELFASELLQIFAGAPDTSMLGDDDHSALDGPQENLTNNELKILTMAGHGLRNKEIAGKLGMTEGSVKWYMQQIYDKLGTRPRTRAIDRARKLGLIP